MASYTIEDIEFIRRKSGIGYQEAIALLDYHGGDVMRALVDLERNGKLQGSVETAREQPQAQPRRSILQTRLVITNKETTIVNFSIIYFIIALVVSPWLVIGSVIASIFFGYRINISTLSPVSNDKIDRMVRSAADNVKSAATNIARNVGNAIERRAAKTEAAPKTETAPKAEAAPRKTVDDFGPDMEEPQAPDVTPEELLQEMEEEAAGHDVPTIQVPVKVDSTDGSVVYTTDADGFGTATIE